MSHAATSLRRSLLRRLAAPLSLLAFMSGLIAYWLAWQYTQHVIDRSLADLATAISKQIQIAGPNARFTIPPLAQAMFSDPSEYLVYRITDGQRDLAGDAELPLSGTLMRRTRYAQIFETRYRGMLVRVAQVSVANSAGTSTIVEVAQPLRHRYRIAAEFLVAIMMPLLLLLVAGWGIVWRVVNQQLNPLTALADSLNRQTHMSLEPVDETHVPIEIRPLTSAMNALLDRLKIALDAQRKFIADAAHQLRTPLTAIKLHAEHAASARDTSQTLTAVHELRAAADRAVRLSNQLLSLARAEPGAHAARFTELDLAALAFETGAEWVPRALAAHVDLGFQRLHDPSGETPLTVRGNAVLLREVVANLIDNAIKYAPSSCPNGTRVTMSVSASRASDGSELAEIDVEDNGSGVPLALQADLFKRFFRGDRASGTAEGDNIGAGLGLAIVQDIVSLHGGTVEYTDASGGGACFTVRIPLVPSTPGEAQKTMRLVSTDTAAKGAVLGAADTLPSVTGNHTAD